MDLRNGGVEFLLVFEAKWKTVMDWCCLAETGAHEGPKWWMVDELWLKLALFRLDSKLPWEEVEENRAGFCAYSWGILLANASKGLIYHKTNQTSSGSLKVWAEKCKGVKMQKWENESILFDWGCSSRVWMTKNRLLYFCLAMVNQVLSKLSLNEAFLPFC